MPLARAVTASPVPAKFFKGKARAVRESVGEPPPSDNRGLSRSAVPLGGSLCGLSDEKGGDEGGARPASASRFFGMDGRHLTDAAAGIMDKNDLAERHADLCAMPFAHLAKV